jgi:hypothetical protein
MVEIHRTYDMQRLAKLWGMFGDDVRQGSPALYVREHFNLRRICENCEARGTVQYFAAASLVAEGDDWVLPFSVTVNGRIIIDLEPSIPDQTNFFSDRAIAGLEEVGIVYDAAGRTEYIVPIESDRSVYYDSLRRDKYWNYRKTQERFTCRVRTDASADDVIKWDTEVEYDYEDYWKAKGEHQSGFNVEAEYFQWLAQHGQLVVARISDNLDATIALDYCVPGLYELTTVNQKRLIAREYGRFGLGNTLIMMLVDYVNDNGLLTPLNLGSVPYQHIEMWRPVPVPKPQLVFANPAAQQAILERFGTE